MGEVSWDLDGIARYGTIEVPEGPGPFPGVVLVAGSGPTDRDWNSPLLPGTNGSGRLLAEALAGAGFASIRFDKVASGPHVRENIAGLIGRLSMASHLAEVAAAVDLLAARPEVDATRLLGLGSSEGCLHVLHYATTPQTHPLIGAVLIGPPGRAVGTVLQAQLAAQLGQLPGGSDLVARVAEAADRYGRGEPMDPDPRLPEPVRQVLASFESPANLPLARELWTEDAGPALARIDVPTLVVIGGKDLQIDALADGDPLRAAAADNPRVTFEFPANANHVLKEETRPREQIVPGTGYNEDGTRLDPEATADILDWMRAVAR